MGQGSDTESHRVWSSANRGTNMIPKSAVGRGIPLWALWHRNIPRHVWHSKACRRSNCFVGRLHAKACQPALPHHVQEVDIGAVPAPAVQFVAPAQIPTEPASVSSLVLICHSLPIVTAPAISTGPTLSVTGQSVSASWDVADWVDHWNERAAVIEFDGGYSREDADLRSR